MNSLHSLIPQISPNNFNSNADKTFLKNPSFPKLHPSQVQDKVNFPYLHGQTSYFTHDPSGKYLYLGCLDKDGLPNGIGMIFDSENRSILLGDWNHGKTGEIHYKHSLTSRIQCLRLQIPATTEYNVTYSEYVYPNEDRYKFFSSNEKVNVWLICYVPATGNIFEFGEYKLIDTEDGSKKFILNGILGIKKPNEAPEYQYFEEGLAKPINIDPIQKAIFKEKTKNFVSFLNKTAALCKYRRKEIIDIKQEILSFYLKQYFFNFDFKIPDKLFSEDLQSWCMEYIFKAEEPSNFPSNASSVLTENLSSNEENETTSLDLSSVVSANLEDLEEFCQDFDEDILEDKLIKELENSPTNSIFSFESKKTTFHKINRIEDARGNSIYFTVNQIGNTIYFGPLNEYNKPHGIGIIYVPSSQVLTLANWKNGEIDSFSIQISVKSNKFKMKIALTKEIPSLMTIYNSNPVENIPSHFVFEGKDKDSCCQYFEKDSEVWNGLFHYTSKKSDLDELKKEYRIIEQNEVTLHKEMPSGKRRRTETLKNYYLSNKNPGKNERSKMNTLKNDLELFKGIANTSESYLKSTKKIVNTYINNFKVIYYDSIYFNTKISFPSSVTLNIDALENWMVSNILLENSASKEENVV